MHVGVKFEQASQTEAFGKTENKEGRNNLNMQYDSFIFCYRRFTIHYVS